ncbi:eva-1 homolog Bb [Nematolebias whitei]|uniref:eva-1 homolog Bb n=1 Tax=Nematolebias whitei TaxID=451745 RepID=UPI00189A3EB6|nr:eva-1 homolog Bb [Nematolebias whitei]
MEPVKRDLELLSNSMATYAHIRANPESLALFFMTGVCFGLFTALCLLLFSIACRTHRLRPPPSPERRRLKEFSEDDDEESGSEEDNVDPEALKGTLGPRSERSSHGTLRSVDVFTSVEEMEKARRLEERERIVREIWRNGQPDVLVTGTGTLGRVHYH